MVHANIIDAVYNELPAQVWNQPESDKPKIKPMHRKWIRKSVYDALSRSGIKNAESWSELYLTGSLTTYQYGDDSDVDVSIFVTDKKVAESLDRGQLISILIESIDGKTLPGTTYPMQCYVVPFDIEPSDLFKPGIRSGYDIQKDEWLEPPDRDRAHDVEREMNDLYVQALEAADKMERLIRYEPDKAVLFWHQIHDRRRRDQKAGKGDYSASNIIYKFLFKRGIAPSIAEVAGEYIAKHNDRDWNFDGR